MNRNWRRLPKTLIKLIDRVVGTPRSGAEIGVFRGRTSVALIKRYPACRFVFVDPWKEYEAKVSQAEWDDARAVAVKAILDAAGDNQVDILEMPSAKAAARVGDRQFDFVFIDADHSEKNTRRDIKLWLPKATRLICGHDYGSWRHPGVAKAVHHFFDESELILPGSTVWGYAINETAH